MRVSRELLTAGQFGFHRSCVVPLLQYTWYTAVPVVVSHPHGKLDTLTTHYNTTSMGNGETCRRSHQVFKAEH